MRNFWIKLYRILWDKRFTLKRKEQIYVFFSCLLMSCLFWLMISLSEETVSHIKLKINYRNFPQDKVVVNSLPDHLTMRVKSMGYRLLRYQVVSNTDTVHVDYEDISRGREEWDKVGVWVSNRYKEIFQTQLKNKLEVHNVYPDTIYFRFSPKVRKKLKVNPQYTVEFEGNFQLRDSIYVEPNVVEVEGAKSVLDTLEEISIVPTHIQGPTADLRLDVKLDTTGVEYVHPLQESVSLVVPVEVFAEESKKVPIELINVPENIDIKLYPSEVEVFYLVGLNKIQNVSASGFRIVADYNEVEVRENQNLLRVRIDKEPREIRSNSTRVATPLIECIIREKK